MIIKMTGYELSRAWWDFAFENPEKVKPTHAALFFFAIENCNRMGWAEKFRLPSEMAMAAIGVHSYKTYIGALNDLCEWGFLIMVQKSTNQYSANIVALVNFTEAQDKAHTKALDKALLKQSTKQVQSIDSINKQETKNKKQQTNTGDLLFEIPTLEQIIAYADEKGFMDGIAYEFFEKYTNLQWKKKIGGEPVANWKLTMQTWMKRDYNAKWKKPVQSTRYQTYNPEIHK